MMKKLYIIFFGCFFFLNGFMSVQNVMANDAPRCEQGRFNSDCLFPTWQSEERPSQSKEAAVQGVIGANHDGGFIMNYIPNVIDILLKFVAPIVTLMLIWTGILFITSHDDDGLNKAKEFLTYSILGVGIIVLSYSILKFVYFLVAHG
jgi:hypothetical protein